MYQTVEPPENHKIEITPIQELGEASQDSYRAESQSQHSDRVLLKNPSGQLKTPDKVDQNMSTVINKSHLPPVSGFFSLAHLQIPERAKSNRLFLVCYIISTHYLFTMLITLFIMVNTAVLALASYPRDLEREKVSDLLNDIFTWCFFVEMLIKLLGLGFKEYVRDAFNVFDAVLVIISLVDFVISTLPQNGDSSTGALSAFRGIRLLRVFKLARSWTSFRELLGKIFVTVKDVSTFSILLMICMFIFTLLGMELFGHKIKFDENGDILDPKAPPGTPTLVPRPNFDSFAMGFTSIFIVFIGEDWQLAMHSHYRVEGEIALFFFPLIFIVLNLVLLNLFLAILL